MADDLGNLREQSARRALTPAMLFTLRDRAKPRIKAKVGAKFDSPVLITLGFRPRALRRSRPRACSAATKMHRR